MEQLFEVNRRNISLPTPVNGFLSCAVARDKASGRLI